MNSIRMPAVMVNQIAEKTGAVVRNFFIERLAEGQKALRALNRKISGERP